MSHVRPSTLVGAAHVGYAAAVSIFRTERASTFLETKYSIYLETELHGVIISRKIITLISSLHKI